MRALLQPRVLNLAALAALFSALGAFPRIYSWADRKYPIWYYELVLFLGAIFLWGFVFAWHQLYSGRPPFTLRIKPSAYFLVAIGGATLALLLNYLVDGRLRARTPEDYPASAGQWMAMTLFSISFTQLFLVFAPLAWLIRLFRKPSVAVALTIVFGVIVLLIKSRSQPVPNDLLMILLLVRIVGGLAAIYIYLQGGVLLASLWTLVLQSRHLLHLAVER